MGRREIVENEEYFILPYPVSEEVRWIILPNLFEVNYQTDELKMTYISSVTAKYIFLALHNRKTTLYVQEFI